MTLGWKVPKFSGGTPILGYYVDKREVHHENWHEVNASPIQERILTVGSFLLPPLAWPRWPLCGGELLCVCFLVPWP